MSACRFKVVFEKLAEASEQDPQITVERVSFVREELDEIAELRRLSLELTEPEPQSYTVT
jgi:hypothetical protein